MPNAVRLAVCGVDKAFGATVALRHVELEAFGGEVHAIIGENGAGKSTLMHILAGSLTADSGSLELDGQPYRPDSPLEARTLGVALVSQELSICPHLSVLDNVMLGQEVMRWGRLDRTSMQRQVLAALAPLVGGAPQA
jgi:ribose transport system ATP-binding protein